MKSRRQVWFRETGAVDATIYDRGSMPAGLRIPGPAVIESLESTILVPPGWQAKMDDDGFVLLTRERSTTMTDARRNADPATFEIVKNSLYKIAEEMRVVLAKTAYSPLLKSAGDYSCGVFDARGEMVAQGPDLPIHLGSMPDAVRAVVGAFAHDVHDWRRLSPQRSLFRRQPLARRERGAACLSRGPAARLRLPARALARRRLGHARQLRRRDRHLRRGAAHAAAAAHPPRRAQRGPREADPRQRAHARRAQRRSRRPARRHAARHRAAARARPPLWRRRAHRLHGARSWIIRSG